jgi:hypothetical protein
VEARADSEALATAAVKPMRAAMVTVGMDFYTKPPSYPTQRCAARCVMPGRREGELRRLSHILSKVDEREKK